MQLIDVQKQKTFVHIATIRIARNAFSFIYNDKKMEQ